MLIANNRLKMRLGHEDQAVIQGDPDRLKQLLLNLVNNAIAYTPDGGTVTLSLHRRPDNWVRVAVADTGVGIAPEDLPHIFDRFWRQDKARSRKLGGSGLGLSIAKSIVEAHGGRI
ncbi:MAG: ATP-binding protein, partial [Anaerolineae bacterium]|nr:ATP-binding protein [Anaerolineae bacterium]